MVSNYILHNNKEKNPKIYSPHLSCSMMCVIEIQHKVKGKKSPHTSDIQVEHGKKMNLFMQLWWL